MKGHSKENELQAEQEGGLASSRLCLTLKNPRIIRASRLSGGKDRHSKVTTIRGLRDRRVRLSVPTAVQLYDLQDKLGLNQPSKVVDWLLNAAQHEIDKLPPLQVPPGGFIQFAKSIAISHEANPPQALSHPLTMKNNEIFSANAFDEDLSVAPKHTSWDSVVLLRAKQEEAAREWIAKKNIVQENEVDNQDVGIFRAPVSDNMSVNRPCHSSCPGVRNDAIAYTSYSQSEPPNAYNSLLHSGLMSPSLLLMFGSQQATHSSSTLPLMFSSHTAGLTNFHTN